MALTSQTLMQKAMGNDTYEQVWDFGGIADIVVYSTFAVGAASMIAGAAMATYSAKNASSALELYWETFNVVDEINDNVAEATDIVDFSSIADDVEKAKIHINKAFEHWPQADKNFQNAGKNLNKVFKLGTVGRWMMGIGGALMVMAAVLKGVQLYQFYNRTFSKIPIMIVDEADIVSYTTNSKGGRRSR